MGGRWLLLALLLMVASAPSTAAHTSSGGPLEQRTLEPKSLAQRRAWRSLVPELCLSGRRFGGKSWLGCAKAYVYAARYPGAKVALCREERASMDTTTLATLRDEVVPRELWLDRRWGWREQKSTLFLPNGSTIHVFGLDRPGRALGARYGMVVVDQAEQLDRNQFEIINSCVMQVGMPFHQTLLLFNPDGPEHWAYKRYLPDNGDGVRLDSKGLTFAEVVHVLPDDLLEYLTPQSRERFDRLDGVWRERLRLGRWVAFDGLVFDRWDSAVHIVEPPAEWAAWGGFPPPEWPRFFGIDFGYEPDPFACGWWARDPVGRMYLYRQLCHLRLTIAQQAEWILEHEREELAALRAVCPEGRREELGPYLEMLNLVERYSDHARGERAMLAEYGIATSPAEKDILASVQSVQEGLDTRFGEPRLRIVRGSLARLDRSLRERGSPTCLEEEIPQYVWRQEAAARPSSGLARQLPRQINDHCIDGMLRYVVHSLAVNGSAGVFC